ncbi:MAG: DVUA0089 family protein [Aquabacterium sp.]|uniref:DVUA0089 family protein n=1 Tax=Aquabacterium sp. TaxID=1872578 RepID=UPI0027247FBE|nr:DVUA0089 family protein [Aquabacterium sp.]MDO9002189.1 DVUA0089 family protein [Aquabacterium sp.]
MMQALSPFIRPAAIAAAALALSSLQAQAANFSFDGDLAYNTDVVQVAFTLNAASSQVRLWTDSWTDGLNFDPTLTLWIKDGSGYNLVGDNDDDHTIGPAQGFYDAGLSLATLMAGQYLVTLGAAPNYANGTQLSQGFALDGSTPTLISQWMQPSYNVNANDQKGTFWRLNLSGVDTATTVPEPATAALILAGLSAMLLSRRRMS